MSWALGARKGEEEREREWAGGRKLGLIGLVGPCAKGKGERVGEAQVRLGIAFFYFSYFYFLVYSLPFCYN